MRHLLLLVLTGALVAACSRGDRPAADRPAADPPALERGAGADERALTTFRLTTDRIARATEASEKLVQEMKDDPRLRRMLGRQADHDGDVKSLQEMADRMSSLPPIRKALDGAGISARDFVLVMFATMQASMANAYGANAAALAAHIPRENVAFVREHAAEVARFEEAMRRVSPDSL